MVNEVKDAPYFFNLLPPYRESGRKVHFIHSVHCMETLGGKVGGRGVATTKSVHAQPPVQHASLIGENEGT